MTLEGKQFSLIQVTLGSDKLAYTDVMVIGESDNLLRKPRILLALLCCFFASTPVVAVDSWQLVRDEICAKQSLDVATAAKLSFFQFRRIEGFECATRAMKVLLADIANNPQAKVNSSRLLWTLFAAAAEDPSRDNAFRSIASEIRLADMHPLRGEARLAQMRLTVLRGRPEADFYPQLDAVLSDLGLVPNVRGLSAMYSEGTTAFREALQWLFIARTRAQTAASAGGPVELRLRSLASLGNQLAVLGATEPEILHLVTADAWKRGARLITPATLPKAEATAAFPELLGKLKYSLCASGDCQQQDAVEVVRVADQIVEKRQSLDISDAVATIRYGIGSSPIVQGKCSTGTKDCTDQRVEETGRHYWLAVNSAVSGGAAWKDGFLKKVKGTDDRYSEVNYNLMATVKIPRCVDANLCAVMVQAKAHLQGAGDERGVSRAIRLKRPDGATTSLANDDVVALDRSAGAHEFVLEAGMSRGEKGSTSSGNSSVAAVSVQSAARLSKSFVQDAKAALQGDSAPLGKYLPLLLASRALTLRPEVFANAPEYMGLGEALGQYADPNPANRWDNVYVPLLVLYLLRTQVGADLLPDERQGMDLTRKLLSRIALDSFKGTIDQQLKLLTAIQPALSVASIDGAINAIQKEQSLETDIAPYLAAIMTADPNNAVGDQSMAKARDLVAKARLSDNLLDAVLRLYEARERMTKASERVALRVQLLTVEQTGFPTP
jgi:hypothetical protein